MLDSGIPTNKWDLALGAAVHAYNRTPYKSNGYETLLSKLAPNVHCHLEQLRRFGCMTIVKTTRKPDTKFSARGKQTFLIGYTDTGYLLLHPEWGKILGSRNVFFKETETYRKRSNGDKTEMKNEVKLSWNEEKKEEQPIPGGKQPCEEVPKGRGRPRKQDMNKTIELEQRKVPKRRSERV